MPRGNPLVGMRLNRDTIAWLDCLATAHGLTRGQLVQLADWPADNVVTPQMPGQLALEDLPELARACSGRMEWKCLSTDK